MDSRRLGRVHIIDTNRQPEKCIFGSGCTIAVHSEDAYYGHLVLRLMGCFVLFYTSRVICKGRMTMEEIIFSLKHYLRFVDFEAFELKALSWGMGEKAA